VARGDVRLAAGRARAPGAGDPLAAGVAGLAAVLGGSTRAAVELLLVGALPAAALVAWHAAGAWTASRALRLWAALAWAAAPTLLIAVAAAASVPSSRT
jgi:hypothetical protein